MKIILLVACLLGLSGCGTIDPSFLENRVVCTVAKDKASTVSQWGPIGISSDIREADAKVICTK